MSSSPPTTLGKYQIIREIARSNDIVYEAYDPLMNRRVALKELAMPAGMSDQQREDRVKRFLREARAAGSLTHPNIMTVFEVGQEGERYFIAMEYLDGHTLRNEIDTLGFIPQDRAVEIAIEVLRGLEFAHSRGVIHRDIKPDNIQLLSNGQVKLTDFGIARLTFEPNLTMDGQVFGTPSYMSPEQVVGKDIDARSDLFSVGILLYEMLSGKKPFHGDSVVSITYAIMNKEPEPLQQANFSLSQAIGKALDKSPGMRFGNAGEMVKALESSLQPVQPMATAQPLPQQPTMMPGAFQGNPYLTQQPQYPAPYQYPQQQPIAPPPVAYPYNPYSPPGQGGAIPPHTPGYGGYTQNPYGGPIPVYYPPPPRGPLVKPETKQFIGKLFLSLIIIGTLGALVVVGVQAASTAWMQNQAESGDNAIIARMNKISTSIPLEDQIEQRTALLNQLRSDTRRKEASQTIAVLHERLGKQNLQRGNVIAAEDNFLTSVQLDPTNAALHSNLGDLYTRFAMAESDAGPRSQFWKQSAESWEKAAENEPSSAKRSKYSEAAAVSYYQLANDLYLSNQFSEARQALYSAERWAPENGTVNGRIRQLWDLLNSR